MLRPRKMPPFFKLTLVVLCAYILWTFNHPENVYTPGDVHLVRTRYSYANGGFNEGVQGPNMQGYNREYPPNQPPQPPMARVAEKVNILRSLDQLDPRTDRPTFRRTVHMSKQKTNIFIIDVYISRLCCWTFTQCSFS